MEKLNSNIYINEKRKKFMDNDPHRAETKGVIWTIIKILIYIRNYFNLSCGSHTAGNLGQVSVIRRKCVYSLQIKQKDYLPSIGFHILLNN